MLEPAWKEDELSAASVAVLAGQPDQADHLLQRLVGGVHEGLLADLAAAQLLCFPVFERSLWKSFWVLTCTRGSRGVPSCTGPLGGRRGNGTGGRSTGSTGPRTAPGRDSLRPLLKWYIVKQNTVVKHPGEKKIVSGISFLAGMILEKKVHNVNTVFRFIQNLDSRYRY